jgi:hypothetical protein
MPKHAITAEASLLVVLEPTVLLITVGCKPTIYKVCAKLHLAVMVPITVGSNYYLARQKSAAIAKI